MPTQQQISKHRMKYPNLLLVLPALIILNFYATSPSAEELTNCGAVAPTAAEETSKQNGNASDHKPYQSCFYSTYGLGVSLLDPEGTSNGWSSDDRPSIGASIGIGWDLSNHWFSELRYTYLGDASLENSNAAVNKAIDGAIRYHAPSLMLGRKLIPDSPDFNAYIKIGSSWIHSKESHKSIDHDEDENLQASIGAGLRFNVQNSPWFVDFVYDGFSKDVNIISLQFNRYFGSSKSKAKIIQPSIEQPKPDDDHDGVPDDLDRCPFSKSGEKVDKNGCCLPENGCTVSFPEQ